VLNDAPWAAFIEVKTPFPTKELGLLALQDRHSRRDTKPLQANYLHGPLTFAFIQEVYHCLKKLYVLFVFSSSRSFDDCGQKIPTAYDHELPPSPTEQYIHSSKIAQEAESTANSRVVVVSNERYHNEVCLTSLK
jgi:hypothetical protein